MTDIDRRYALAGVVLGLGLLTGVILLEVLGTILFAITVAYVLVPVQHWLVRRGLTEWTAAGAATLIGFLGALAVFAPLFVTVYYRLGELEALVRGLPPSVPLTAFGETYVLEAATIQEPLLQWLRGVAVSLAIALPELAIKFGLFAMLLFALLCSGDAAARAAVAPVPPAYRDVAYALGARARETLYAIYVLQVATGIATLLIAYPLFWLLGYEAAFTLAMIAAVLQFVPIIGPSLLILPLAGYEFVAGDPVAGALVGGLGLLLVGWFPDVAIRPRLARRSAGLPGSLYFVGFTGGLFTLGPIGIVVGPLVVAVFVEAVELLAAEVNDRELDAFESLGDELLPSSDAATIEPSTDAGNPSAESVEPGGETTFAEEEIAGADE